MTQATQYRLQRQEGVAVLSVSGSVMSDGNQEFSKQMEDLHTAGDRLVVIDCSGLEYMNSQALGDLMMFHHELLGANGRLALAGLQPVVDKVVRSVGLAQVISVFDTAEDALAAMKGQ